MRTGPLKPVVSLISTMADRTSPLPRALSVVIPSVTGFADLDGCLAAVERQRADVDLEIIVVDRLGDEVRRAVAMKYPAARVVLQVDGLRTLVWHAAWTLDRGEEGYVEALRAHDQASEVAVQVTSDAVQVLGGHGYLWDHPVEKWMRDARTLGLVDGLFFDDHGEV